MVIYPDASALVALFKTEIHSPQATAILDRSLHAIQLSDFTIAEVSAALAANFREHHLGSDAANDRFILVDKLLAGFGAAITVNSYDMAETIGLVRLDLRLRAPDALHLAICRRIGATLLTFDKDQSAAAVALGIPLAR